MKTNEPREQQAAPRDPPNAQPRKRAWCAVRIEQYRLQALAPSNPDEPRSEPEWTDLGGDTIVSTDREEIFQLARRHAGLLMSAQGLPSAGRCRAFCDKVIELTKPAPATARANDDAEPF